MPPNPGGWITTTARNRAIDRLRRESTRNQRHHAPYRVPRDAEFPDRLHAVLAAVYLFFTEGHTVTSGLVADTHQPLR